MNIDEILLEWSYRLPNGYPTVVNGRFVDNKEIAVLNQILEEMGLGQTLKIESTKRRISEELSDEDLDKILSSQTILDLDIGSKKIEGKDIPKIILYVSGILGGERKSLLVKIADELNGRYVSKYSSAGAVEATYEGMPYYILLKVLAEDKTSTNVKEGVPVVLAQLPDIKPATAETVVSIAQRIVKAVNGDEIIGVSADVKKEILEYFETIIPKAEVNARMSRQLVKKLNESISQASSFRVFSKTNPNFLIDRASLFDEIRSAAQRIVKLRADKWCPGDIYFIRNGAESKIRSTLQDAVARPNAEEGISLINNLFSTIEDFDQKVSDEHDIVAVSLKESRAQAGKLKSAFKQYEGTPEEYNITDEEYDMPEAVLKDSITDMRKDLNQAIAADSTSYIYDESDLNGIADVRTLRGKYAAYKAVDYIRRRVARAADRLDDAFVGLVAFGFGIIQQGTSTINPPFLKLISDASGNPTKPQYFEPGRTLALLSLAGEESPAQIEIRDTQRYAGLQVVLTLLLIGSEADGASTKMKYEMNFRYNGGKQITIELGKPTEIN